MLLSKKYLFKFEIFFYFCLHIEFTFFSFQENSSQWNLGGLTFKKNQCQTLVGSPSIFYFKKIVQSEIWVGSPLKKITVKFEWTHLLFFIPKNSSQWNFGGLTYKKTTVKLE